VSALPAVASAPQAAPPAGRFVSLAVTCSLPVLLITADVLAGGPLRRLDDFLAAGGWHRADAAVTSVAYVFDRLGQRAVAGSILVAVAAFLAWRGRSWRPLVITGAGLGMLNLVVGAMKLTIGRSKPLSGQDLLYVGGSQFPSGHAASGFAFASAIGREQPWLGLALRFLAAAVAYSRVHTGVHYPGDIVVGSLIGASTGQAVAGLMDHLPLTGRPSRPDPDGAVGAER